MTEWIAVGVFIVAVVIFAKLKPGKTGKDLVLDGDENLLYEAHDLGIVSYPRLGRPVSWPGSKIQITNKRIIFSQKGLMSATYVIREIAVHPHHPPESLKNVSSWGLVPVFPYSKDDFSVTTKNQKTVILFSNQFAPNSDHREIVGVVSVGEFMQAIDAANTTTSERPSESQP